MHRPLPAQHRRRPLAHHFRLLLQHQPSQAAWCAARPAAKGVRRERVLTQGATATDVAAGLAAERGAPRAAGAGLKCYGAKAHSRDQSHQPSPLPGAAGRLKNGRASCVSLFMLAFVKGWPVKHACPLSSSNVQGRPQQHRQARVQFDPRAPHSPGRRNCNRSSARCTQQQQLLAACPAPFGSNVTRLRSGRGLPNSAGQHNPTPHRVVAAAPKDNA